MRENRHSDVVMSEVNLRWYGPRMTHPQKTNPRYIIAAHTTNRSTFGMAPFIVRMRMLYFLKKPKYLRNQ